MERFLLLKPYSVWTLPFTQEAKKGGYIAKFTLIRGMYRESPRAFVGISINDSTKLKESGLNIIKELK